MSCGWPGACALLTWEINALEQEGKPEEAGQCSSGETLCPGNHVDVNLIPKHADKVHPFMAAVFINSSDLGQQDNAL